MMTKIRTIGIVSTGVIGAGWTTYFLSRGFDVVATGRSAGAEVRLRARVAEQWGDVERMGLAEGASQTRLRFVASLPEAIKEVDFIQENGPERLETKRAMIAAIDEAARPDVVIASSSSGIPISEVQSSCRHPARVLIGHPFNPTHLIPLVEVVGGKATSAEAVESAMRFYGAIGKRPIRVRKEIKGHIANRLQAAIRREAYGLVAHGVATVADIDLAISHGPGLRWSLLGPFLVQHLAGGRGGIQHHLDHLGPAMDVWWQDLYQTRLTTELKEMIVAGVMDMLEGSDVESTTREARHALIELLQLKERSKHLP
jgi:3-hydroxyacyl-CoA dehydrogenase